MWIGDYVLAGYGTGAVMAVPAHDERDYKFAGHFGLPRPQVIEPTTNHDFEKDAWGEKEGKLIHSDFLNGLDVKTAIKNCNFNSFPQKSFVVQKFTFMNVYLCLASSIQQ